MGGGGGCGDTGAEERESPRLTIFRIAALEWLAAVEISSRASANRQSDSQTDNIQSDRQQTVTDSQKKKSISKIVTVHSVLR